MCFHVLSDIWSGLSWSCLYGSSRLAVLGSNKPWLHLPRFLAHPAVPKSQPWVSSFRDFHSYWLMLFFQVHTGLSHPTKNLFVTNLYSLKVYTCVSRSIHICNGYSFLCVHSGPPVMIFRFTLTEILSLHLFRPVLICWSVFLFTLAHPYAVKNPSPWQLQPIHVGWGCFLVSTWACL